MQGRKDSGRNWYLVLKAILEDVDFHQCPAEPALFVLYDSPAILIVVTSSNEFLCVYSHEDLFSSFKIHMEKFEEGNSPKYLNVSIIQTTKEQASTKPII